MLRKYILLCCYGSLPKNKLLSPHKSGPFKTQAPPPLNSQLNSSFKNIYTREGVGVRWAGGAGVVEGVVVLDQKQRVEEKKIFDLT